MNYHREAHRGCVDYKCFNAEYFDLLLHMYYYLPGAGNTNGCEHNSNSKLGGEVPRSEYGLGYHITC